MRSIGTMSGTSMDGLDVALIETNGYSDIQEKGHFSLSYTPEFKVLLKAAEHAVRACHGNLFSAQNFFPQAINEYLAQALQIKDVDGILARLSTYLYGHPGQNIQLEDVIKHSTYLNGYAIQQLLKKIGYTPKEIDVIGYHGQTLFHQPSQHITIQVGDGAALARQTGITVVNDFRRQDVEAGGQGAPFAPLYHLALSIRDRKWPVAVVNCGGIANVTFIQNIQEENLIGFDTGPGNALIDRLVRQRTKGQENMDEDGRYARQGKVHPLLFQALYAKAIIKDEQNYFEMPPPKSLDYNDIQFIPELNDFSLPDACRTLAAFTADTIVASTTFISSSSELKHWVLAGGGWKNPILRQEFQDRLEKKIKHAMITTADEIGWQNQALEAQIFAYLAVRSLQNNPISFPGITQVPHPLSGGTIHLPNSGATTAVEKLLIHHTRILR